MSESVAQDMIRSFFERWQRLEEEKRTLSDDLKELFAEAKANGFDTKAMRAVFRAEVGDKAEQEEFDAICDLYRNALRPRAHPARENVTKFPSIASVNPSGHARKGSSDANAGGDHEGITPDPIEKEKFEKIDEDVTLRAGVVASGSVVETDAPFEPPAFLRRDEKPLRPHCQNPDDCGGYGKIHCRACLVSAGAAA